MSEVILYSVNSISWSYESPDLCCGFLFFHNLETIVVIIQWREPISPRFIQKYKELFRPYFKFCPSTCWIFRRDFHSSVVAAKPSSKVFPLRDRWLVSLTSRRTHRWWWAAAESARTLRSQRSASRTEAASCPCSEIAAKKMCLTSTENGALCFGKSGDRLFLTCDQREKKHYWQETNMNKKRQTQVL